MEEIVIRLHNASIQLKDFVINPINMEIPRGYVIGVQGDNGAGKSTLLKMILGMYPKMKGNITVCGFDVVKQREEMLSHVGYISEKRVFFEEEHAIGNEAYYASYYKNWNGERYRQMLKKQNISQETKVGRLSKGERVKFQMAFAAAYEPEVMLLDEPTTGLDPVVREDFLRMLQEAVAQWECTILLATHIDEDLSRIADYRLEVKKRFSKKENEKHETFDDKR